MYSIHCIVHFYRLASTPTNSINQSANCTYLYYCTGISSWSLWNVYDTNTIMMNIDTTNCSLSEVPVYFTSMGGLNQIYALQSYDAIYSPTIDSFGVLARSILGWNSSTMLSYAQSYAWDLNWLGMFH
ncbi:unnamed protein product [Rotaria magnacalcarata]|uniref:Uncharacterized protein n=1 Tax=Rotaria magnacalcarata TaxID=392030 RepID=A0A816QX69_9BILA|nr:unnamed protein product [Rotaria magnacalcarata]